MLSLQACPSHSVQCSRLAVVSLLPTLLRGSPEPSGTESNSLWGLPGPANMDGLLASPHGAMLILPPPRPQAERRPSPLPSWSLDSPQAPCLSFPASLSPLQGTRKVLQHLLDKLNPGLCTWLAKHPPASEDADLRGRPQAWGHRGPATSLRAEGSQNGGSSCPGQGHVWPGEGAGRRAALW